MNGDKDKFVPASKEEIIIPEAGDLAKYKHMQKIMRHIRNVQDSSELMAERLVERGNADFARLLVSNCQVHDNSKFAGIEWIYLVTNPEDEEKLKIAMHQHVTTNKHHPEFWNGIREMPGIFLAEMTADWHARSTEFGTDLREWIRDVACKKYDITQKMKVYRTIKEFLDFLLDKPFK